MIVIGHRGAAGYEPENTLRSFKTALALKVDMIEFDVHVCSCGKVVIIHDEKINRTANGKGLVLKRTFSDLRKLDFGLGEKIPSLPEALNLIDRQAKVNIELKGQKTAAPVAKIISRYVKEKNWQYQDFMVSSFDKLQLRAFKRLCPKVKIGLLFNRLPTGYIKYAKKFPADSINANWKFVNLKIVNRIHKNNLKIFVWTVNERNDIEKMKALKVDGIFSNFPDRAN
jgi:glycerophosphoryl diester phosphodiesterase